MFLKNMFRQITGVLLLLLAVNMVGCSKSSNEAVTGANNLKFITPYLAPITSIESSTIYVGVTNSTNAIISGISYSVSTANNLPTSLTPSNNCGEINPGNTCFLQLILPVGIQSTSIKITAVNQSGFASSSLIGIQPVQLTNATGADGVSLFYANTVLAGVPAVMITGVVTSSTVNEFNSVRLVDLNGQVLPNQVVVSDNLGNNLTNLSQGDTFTILLSTVPGTVSQNFRVQTFLTYNGQISDAITGSTVYNLNTVTNKAILAITPTTLIFNTESDIKELGLENIGDIPATKVSVTSVNDELIISNATSDNLPPGQATEFNISIDSSKTLSATPGIIVSYDNGQSVINQVVNVNFGSLESSGIELNFDPDNNFITTTWLGLVSRVLEITNTSMSEESGLNFVDIPTNFSLSEIESMGGAPLCKISGLSITNSLESGSSCLLLVTYTNSSLAQGYGIFTLNYKYNSSYIGQTSSYVNYGVNQSTAILQFVEGDNTNFDSIANNNSSTSYESFTLINTGDIATYGINESIINTSSPNLFVFDLNGIVNPCIGNVSSESSCSAGIQFGPSMLPIDNNYTGVFMINYAPYQGGVVLTESLLLQGSIRSAQSAVFNISIESAGFVGGDGSSLTPLALVTSESATISVNYNNTGQSDATLVSTNQPTLPTGWTLLTHGCSNYVSVNIGASCTDVYQVQSSTSGIFNLNFESISINFNDESGMHNNVVVLPSNNPLHIQVFNPATLETESQLINVSPGESGSINIRLVSGYAVESQEISWSASLPTGISVTPNSCYVSSQSPMCSFNFSIESSVIPDNYPITFVNLGNVVFTPGKEITTLHIQ